MEWNKERARVYKGFQGIEWERDRKNETLSLCGYCSGEFKYNDLCLDVPSLWRK